MQRKTLGTARRTRYGHHDMSCDRHADAGNLRFLDIQLFSPERLETVHGMHDAHDALDNFLHEDNLESLRFMVDTLIAGPPYLLEYVISIAMDESRYDRFLSTLQRTFPSSASAFPSSLARVLIERLRVFYLLSLSLDLPPSLNDCHRGFETALDALDALKDMKFTTKSTMPKAIPAAVDGITTKQSQRQSKLAKRNNNQNSLTDNTPFVAIGTDIPSTKEKADELAAKILTEQTKLLEEYLANLRTPELMVHLATLRSNDPDRPKSPETPISKASVTPKANKAAMGTSSSSETDVHPAYPHIQPMKAAKYFSEPAEGFGPWNLLLSSRAIQHLKGFHRDQKVWSIIKKKMQELSKGFFSDSNQKLLIGNDNDIPIYEAKLSRDLRIVYQIDIAPEDGTLNDVQVIRLWGIHTHTQINQHLWKSISQHHSSIGREYRLRCLYRATPKHPGQNIINPHSWSTAVEKTPAEPVAGTSMSTEEQLELHSILALEKFTRMSQTLLNNIIADQDAAYPFELTSAEQKIRDYHSSCFVLGRSGTGKTTTMVFKMMNYETLRIQQSTQVAGALVKRPLRQLFVTQSRILVGRVHEYFTKMMLSHMTGHKTSQELQRLAQRNKLVKGVEEMPDLDDEDDERADLPKKFSELEDDHFPLFVTVDQLCKLLEADCCLTFKRRPRTKEHRRAEQRSHAVEVADRDMNILDNEDDRSIDTVTRFPTIEASSGQASMVTYDVFRYGYWPHFSQLLTKGLDPGLVYNELLGVIKGSEETLAPGNDKNFLEKETYLNLSQRRQSTFSRQRERIYELFDDYRKLKAKRDDYDTADRTHAILRALAANTPFKWKVDYLYVDEAQDNLIIDAQLLRLLCGNPHGLFWAGDTAQTISMGSSFRFDDLKSFIYRIEEKSSATRLPVHPASFQLDINYRSHAGVVNCAHSIVELITKFWPHSIDSLARERGLVDGPRPIVFSGWDPEATSYEQFLSHESSQIELGAQQCILVRNDQARENLRIQIGEVGLVMTLYEAKGLEFNDVLLYNFFTDSIAGISDWRVVLNAIEYDKRGSLPAPRFDENRHAALCSELKSLYVGITRARSHIWILDHSEIGEPMRIFWESQSLIQICRPGDPPPKLAVKSTPEQWAQQGHYMFKNSHFKHAMMCFERAALPFERSIAYAYLLRQNARRLLLQYGHKASAIDACLRAAESFIVCAGISSSESKRTKYFSFAADLYSSGLQVVQAAQAYLNAGKYTQAVQSFKRAGLYDEAVDIVLHHRSEVDQKVADQCRGIARLHLHREGQLLKAARLFDGGLEEHLLYLEDYGFDNARLTLLKEHGRWVDAAELLYEQRQHFEAILLWLRADDLGSKRRACEGLLDNLWKTLPLGANENIDDPLRSRFLELLHTLHENLDESQREESVAFKAILNKNTTQLLDLARTSYRSTRSNPMVTLLCFDFVLRQPPPMQHDNAKTVSRYLEDYDTYAQLMRTVVTDWKKARAAALLGLVEVVGDSAAGVQEIHVLSTSVLYQQSRQQSISGDDNDVVINADRLPSLIRLVLGERMMQRLYHEHSLCLRTKALRPCISLAVTGVCPRKACPHDHVSRESHDRECFNLRIRLHMQQILIVHYMDLDCRRSNMQRIWLNRLHEVAFPTHYGFGHISALIESSIPEYPRAMQILRGWIYDRFYSLRFHRDGGDFKFLTEVVQSASLGFTFHRDYATYYTRRAPCIVKLRPPPLLDSSGGYILHDLINFFEAKLESGTEPDFSRESAVIRGASFIKHVLEYHIPIDVDTLLNVMEFVIGRAIIASRLSLHDLTLPRSWILTWLPAWYGGSPISCDTTVLRILYEPLRKLLEAICSPRGVEHLDYADRPLSTASFIARGVLSYRICRSVTLLGYNNKTSRHEVRTAIVGMMDSIGKIGCPYSPLITPYIKAGSWAKLSRTLRSSNGYPLDELIVMQKKAKSPAIYQPPRAFKLLRYDNESDILVALTYQNTSKFNPEAAPFVPSVAVQQAVVPIADEGTSDEESVVDEPPSQAIAHIEISPNDPSVHTTKAEIDAAEVFQRRYLRRLAVKSMTSTQIGQIRAIMYAKSLSEIDKLEVSRQYRHMFLGPLPHVLTALKGCEIAIQKTKRLCSKRLLNAKTIDLDWEAEFATTCNGLRDTRVRLWKTLEPMADLHRPGSSSDLKQAVEESSHLFQETLAVTSGLAEFAWDMEIGYKGIARAAAARPTGKIAQKPSLNTEDLDP